MREQLSRLGDTPFELGAVAMDLPPGVMVPRSESAFRFAASASWLFAEDRPLATALLVDPAYEGRTSA